MIGHIGHPSGTHWAPSGTHWAPSGTHLQNSDSLRTMLNGCLMDARCRLMENKLMIGHIGHSSTFHRALIGHPSGIHLQHSHWHRTMADGRPMGTRWCLIGARWVPDGRRINDWTPNLGGSKLIQIQHVVIISNFLRNLYWKMSDFFI
jgi:hypothetical protein